MRTAELFQSKILRIQQVKLHSRRPTGPCHASSCDNRPVSGALYCIGHLCEAHLCKQRRIPNGRYCRKHTCAEPGCYRFTERFDKCATHYVRPPVQPWPQSNRAERNVSRSTRSSGSGCEVCGKPIKQRGAGERAARGVAGATGYATVGAIIGTIALPGIGTLLTSAVLDISRRQRLVPSSNDL